MGRFMGGNQARTLRGIETGVGAVLVRLEGRVRGNQARTLRGIETSTRMGSRFSAPSSVEIRRGPFGGLRHSLRPRTGRMLCSHVEIRRGPFGGLRLSLPGTGVVADVAIVEIRRGPFGD